MKRDTEVLVIGSGLAGLSAALKVSAYADVTVVTKKDLAEANTNYAQGGIAAVMSLTDDFSKHIQDTLACGDGLCDPAIVERVVCDAPKLVRELEAIGAAFSKKGKGTYDLGLEGGHSERRIVRSHDLTGREIERALVAALKRNKRVTVIENTMALDLLLAKDPSGLHHCRGNRALGARVLDLEKDKTYPITADIVVLATGGAGKVYLITTNPEIAAGDGMALAYRAGCPLANLEFVQFHPTCLYHPSLRN
ncbi:MAG: FAD-dependent oxidoreductase, partial [Elusimicrobiota bacterium]